MERLEGWNTVAYITTRKITTDECPWLGGSPESTAINGLGIGSIDEGEILHPFYGPTYGCVTPAGVAVSREPGRHPFFEVPRGAVRIVGVD